jgi:alcohol dehydrogenase
MNAIVTDAPRGHLALREVAEPALPPHGARIEVRATGVCRSDWHAWMGHDPTVAFPHVPGHEFAGVVREVGEGVRGVRVGDRVTAPFCCGCGDCGPCRDGHQNLCEHEYQPGFDGWGSWAESVVVPWADVNVVPLPDEIGFDEAASLGCRFMTAFAGLVDRAALRPGESVAVIGCGGLGLAAVMIAAASGARVVAVDVAEEKLALARTFGAEVVVDAREAEPVAAIVEATDGGAHVSVDALGSPATAAQGVRSLRRRGRHVQLGLLLAGDAAPPVPMLELIKRELTITGGHGMPARRYPEMLRFVRERRLDVGALIGARRPLSEAHEAMEAMSRFAPRGVTLLTP